MAEGINVLHQLARKLHHAVPCFQKEHTAQRQLGTEGDNEVEALVTTASDLKAQIVAPSYAEVRVMLAKMRMFRFSRSNVHRLQRSIHTVPLQLPALVQVMIADSLPLVAQRSFRLTCRSWRDRLTAQDLTHTIRLSPYGGWEKKAKQMKYMFPKITIQVQDTYSGAQRCLQLLTSPYCDVVSLHCHFESHGPAQPGDEQWLRINRLAELQHLLVLKHMVAYACKEHARLELEMSVTYNHAPPQSEDLHMAFNMLLPSISGLSVSGNFSSVVQKAFPFSHLSRLELTLPNARCVEVRNGSAVQHLKKTLASLHNLCNLQLHADCLSIQPAAITDVLTTLPGVTSLKVDSGFSPCSLPARHMGNIVSLCLGREVLLDKPPSDLQYLHLAYFSDVHKPLLAQLAQAKRSPTLSVGFCDSRCIVTQFSKLPTSCRLQKSCPHYSLASRHSHVEILRTQNKK